MAMLSLSQVAASLGRKYTNNSGFFELCAPQSYPYTISLSPPSSKVILENFSQVRQWQESFENSPWRANLVKTDVNHRVLGLQRLISKLSFNTPLELEAFVLSYLPAKERAQMVQDDLSALGGPVIKRGSFNAYYALCQLVALPRHDSLQNSSACFKGRLLGIQYFMQHFARKAALLGSDLLIAMQFVDFLAALPATPHLYLRQFSLPHMHSKFIERNYLLLDQLLTLCLPVERQKAFVNMKPDSLMPAQLKTQVCVEEPLTASDGITLTCCRDSKISPNGQLTADLQHNLDVNHSRERAIGEETTRGENVTLPQQTARVEQDDKSRRVEQDGKSNGKAEEAPQNKRPASLSQDSLSQSSFDNVAPFEHSCAQDESFKPFQRFLKRWGFKAKAEMIRLRSLDPVNLFWLDPRQGFAESPARSSELSLELDALNSWQPSGQLKHIIVCENEICYLSLPPISNAIAIWGSGYKAAVLGRLALMWSTDILYWGDLDTHGFAILNQLRFSLAQNLLSHNLASVEEQSASCDIEDILPALEEGQFNQVNFSLSKIRSILMDIPTLEQNLNYAVNEAQPFSGHLSYLSTAERQAYQALLNQTYGQNLRIEQEFIPFSQLLNALSQALPDALISIPENYC